MKRILLRAVSLVPALALQGLFLKLLSGILSPHAALITTLLSILSILFVLYIISNRSEGAYKTLWLLIILSFPLVGATLYLFFGNRRTSRPLKQKLMKVRSTLPPPQGKDSPVQAALAKENPRLAQTFAYVEEKAGSDIQPCEDVAYYPLGEEMHRQMLADLETAEHFIFAEYFIVEEGLMWDSMVEIMQRKASQGVDVRVMYDDLGSISTYSLRNVQALKEKGIKCVPFNPLVILMGTLNNRDHRKMLVIDGKVAFSGGVNLADEYINHIEKHGHWKDIGFRLTGAPVHNYVRMFTEFWNAFADTPLNVAALCAAPADPVHPQPGNGYVLSYYDAPFNLDPVSNNLFVELLSQATRRAWFYTPYLMLGDVLLDAFVRAASRGVDVRIIMPGIPDKKLVYRMSRSYYRVLMEAGVKIYEYTPGFIHAKACIIDEEICTVGTVNLDYRSLYLHFENNALFYKAPLMKDLEADYLDTLTKCQQRTLEDVGTGFLKWMVDGTLRILSPLC